MNRAEKNKVLKNLEKQAMAQVSEILSKGPVVALVMRTARFVESPERGKELETSELPLGYAPASVIRAALRAYVTEATVQGLKDVAEPATAALDELMNWSG